MSTLPPYSTYRTDNKQQMLYPQQLSHGNVLTFTPPGFNQTLNVKFPDCRLAVCEKCKKNYKTRDMCRVRNSHTAEPWSTAFICFTLDDKCTDADGKYVDRPLAVRMIQWQPYCVKQPFDPKTPVCSACKKTNRTRSFCRERHKHRQLPWCTVYVLLSPADSIDPSTRVAPESIPKSSDGIKPEPEKTNDSEDKPADTEGAKKESLAESKDEITSEENGKSSKKSGHGDSDDGDDIHDIAESRTFLAKVSCHASSIHWLELAEFDATDSAAVHGGVVAPEGHMPRSGVPMQPMDPSQYYAQSMGGYAAQQHQFNLKSHQQYFFQMQQRHQQQYAAQQAAWQAQYNQQSSMPGQQPTPAQGAPVSVSVTAGEAAAQQSKQNSDTSGSGATQQQQGQHAQWMYHQQMYQNQIAQFQQAGGVIPQQSQQSAPEQPVDYSQQGHPSPDDIEPAPVHDDEHDGGENEAKRARFV
mmetsp:Transcript_3127/g.4625  ORF Transcript_3127/g.4625 Transcript_3127/m.4625 type:complete len:469 (+) Transcript_3127:166-1572(+)|eukprot:CAMPEP_0194202974 /NCGR_PEP_ID=MMETSP0156-20130528/2876_1 /TAXON_ID=33649 /ORGANISM="Thalassionema nitzschioides, Strain L26-B" /LENGTH=468 /DNA_ID=CAMNT_0038928615 /DNA_START=118 /DNA_END=1524 /DNA_ORIENTATION=-